MDLKILNQNTCTGILIFGIGLFGIESAGAKSPLAPSPVMSPPTNISHASSYNIAQLTDANSPLYGNWKLIYSVDGIVYESILIMRGYSGNMRTRYHDPNKGKQVVDQTMYLKSSSSGLVLLGDNPVDAGTSKKHPIYAADKFLLAIQPDGSLQFLTCDDQQQCSYVKSEALDR